MEEEIYSNTCEIIKVDKLFVKEVEQLKQEYLRIKEKIYNEIIQELEELKEDKLSNKS